MRRGSPNLTPIFLFSSVRASSGKASIISNLSVYLNFLEYKVAVIDFDYTTTLKLKKAYPEAYELEEYQELSELFSPDNPRFQQNFYFTETDKISFFPAFQIKNPSLLFSDASLRDFFIQLTDTFDYVLINLPPGTEYSKIVSDLLAKSYIWRGCKPSSIVISQSDEKSLLNLDEFIQNNQIISYQAEENTYFIFNKVPPSKEEQTYNETELNIAELRKIFTYPLTYVIPFLEEFVEQRNGINTYVLQKNSQINLHIIGLFRILSGSAPLSYAIREATAYQSCISGSLFSRIYPYIEELQKKISAKLFINPTDVQIFIEQSEQNIRIRIRLAALGQKLLGIRSDIPNYQKLTIDSNYLPSHFEPRNPKDTFRTIGNVDRENSYTLSFKSIFTFDDSFYSSPVTSVNKIIPIEPEKKRFPSPILFQQRSVLSEIPTLSNIIGLGKKRKYVEFTDKQDVVIQHGVSPVYIPTEYHLSFNLDSVFTVSYSANYSYYEPKINVIKQINLPSTQNFLERKIEDYSIYDIFARNKEFEFTSDFDIRNKNYDLQPNGIRALPCGEFSLFNDNIILPHKKFIDCKESISNINDIAIAKFSLLPIKTNIESSPIDCIINQNKSIDVSPSKYKLTPIQNPKPLLSNYTEKEIGIGLKQPTFNIIENSHNVKIWFFNEEILRKQKSSKKQKQYQYFFSDYLQKQFFKERNFKPLPKSFSLEDLMLDYNYKINIAITESEHKLNQKYSEGTDFKPELTYNFEHKYMEPDLLIKRRSTYTKPIMYQLFKLGRLMLSNKVLVSNADYKVAYNEIFPVIYFPKAIETTLTRKIKIPVRMGPATRWPNENNPLKLVIQPIVSRNENNSPYSSLSPYKQQHYEKVFYSEFPSLNVNFRTLTLNKPTFLRDYLKYDNLKLLHSEPLIKINTDSNIELWDLDYKSLIDKLDTNLSNPNIFTEKMRFRTEKFISFNWKEFEAKIIDINNEIKERTPLKTQNFIHHKYTEIKENKQLELPKYPTLRKAIRLLDNSTKLKRHNKTFEFTFNPKEPFQGIINNKGYFSSLDKIFIEKAFVQQYSTPNITKRYILKKLAIKVPAPKLGRGKFFIIPEKASETLYKHLLWFITNKAKPIEFEFDKQLGLLNFTSPERNNFKVTYEFKPISNSEKFKHHDDVTLRLNKVMVRKPYKIVNNHIKNLLALAKAQAENATALTESLELNNQSI